jgi:hypothetical protein
MLHDVLHDNSSEGGGCRETVSHQLKDNLLLRTVYCTDLNNNEVKYMQIHWLCISSMGVGHLLEISGRKWLSLHFSTILCMWIQLGSFYEWPVQHSVDGMYCPVSSLVGHLQSICWRGHWVSGPLWLHLWLDKAIIACSLSVYITVATHLTMTIIILYCRMDSDWHFSQNIWQNILDVDNPE